MQKSTATGDFAVGSDFCAAGHRVIIWELRTSLAGQNRASAGLPQADGRARHRAGGRASREAWVTASALAYAPRPSAALRPPRSDMPPATSLTTPPPLPGSDEPLQFDLSCELGAPPEDVFAFITAFERLPEWMPFMLRVRVDNTRALTPGGVGAVRVIDGRTRETVVALEAPRLLAYSASDASLLGMYTHHLGVLTCDRLEPSRTRFRWLFHARPGRNVLLRFVGRHLMPFIFRRSMNNLRRRFPAR